MKEADPPPDNWNDFWRSFWILLDPPPPPATWQVVSGCERVASLFRDYDCHTILEAASGVGLKAITFQRFGFDVAGMDDSALGVELSLRLAKAVGISLPFYCLTWADAPARFAQQFDAVFNDQITNTRTREEMDAAIRCAYAALRPGGILIFGGRDEAEWNMSSPEQVAYHWQKTERSRICWSQDTLEQKVTTLEVRELFTDGIYHHYLHLTERGGQRLLETSGFFISYRWTWEDYVQRLQSAGFSQVIRYQHETSDPPSSAFVSGIAVK